MAIEIWQSAFEIRYVSKFATLTPTQLADWLNISPCPFNQTKTVTVQLLSLIAGLVKLQACSIDHFHKGLHIKAFQVHVPRVIVLGALGLIWENGKSFSHFPGRNMICWLLNILKALKRITGPYQISLIFFGGCPIYNLCSLAKQSGAFWNSFCLRDSEILIWHLCHQDFYLGETSRSAFCTPVWCHLLWHCGKHQESWLSIEGPVQHWGLNGLAPQTCFKLPVNCPMSQ